MKNIGSVLLGSALLFSLISTAQPMDETVRLSSIISIEGYSADLLFHNANTYLTPVSKKKKSKKKDPVLLMNVDKENYRVSTPKDVVVYSKSIAKHPIGHIEYNYVIEVKDDKYRYTYENMVYIPYERNRYGRFEAVIGKKYNIESILINPKFQFRKDILAFINQYSYTESEKLHHRMMELEQADNEENLPDNDW